MTIAPPAKLFSFEEFCLLIQDGQKADLIDGVIYMASPDNTDANELSGWLFVFLHRFLEDRDLGKLYASRVAFRLGPRQAPEPDIAFVRKSRLSLVKRGYVDGPPDLAIEIVSPDSLERDYKRKRKQYQKAGVPEYWILDEIKRKVTLLRLSKEGTYQAVRPKQGTLHSSVLPGFSFRPGWFWQQPLPRISELIVDIEAGTVGG